MSERPAITVAERLQALPSALNCQRIGIAHHVEIVRSRGRHDKREDHWYAEQQAAIDALYLAERMATAIAANPDGFVEWAKVNGKGLGD